MKIHRRTVWQMTDDPEEFILLEDDSYEHQGPVAAAQDVTQTTITQPPAFQTPYIQETFDQARDLYYGGGPNYYPNTTVAPMNPLQQQGFQGALDYAQGGLTDIANQSQGAYGNLLGAINPLQNPFFHATANAITQPLYENLTNQILPQLDAGAVQAGNFGGSRQGIAQGQAVGQTQEAVGNQLGQFGSQAYGQGLNAALGALGQTGTVSQAGLAPSQVQLQTGDALRTFQQQLIDQDIDRFNFNQMQPFNQLTNYANFVGSPVGTATTQTSPGPQTGGIPGAFGGISLGSAANDVLGNFNNPLANFFTNNPWIAPTLGGAYGYFQ